MNIDELVRTADPAATAVIPEHGSPLARKSGQRLPARVPRRYLRRLLVPVSIGTAAVLAGVTIAIITGLANPQPSAAALILDEAAAAAANSTPLTLHHGEYLYTKVSTLFDNVEQTGDGTFYPEYVSTDQAWQTAAGVGETIITYGPLLGFNNGTRGAWIKAGLISFRRAVPA